MIRWKSATAVALLAKSMAKAEILPNGYRELLDEIVHRIARSQVRAGLAVSRELILLYWSIGAEILLRQRVEGWGAKVIDRLGRDLQARFPGVEGFSPRNLKYMRSLAEAWPDPQVVPQRVALLPWGHLRLLLDRVKEPEARDWYLGVAVREGWSREALGHMIEGQLHAREGKSLTNFSQTLPPENSEMAVQVLRDPYNFDFLTLAHPLEERKLERGPLAHMWDLLLELGRASPSSAARSRSRLERRPFTSICSSTMCGCTATSSSSSRRASSSPSTPAS
jgi:predicted nuclease of restriction endonuclease-like (RecB) superfamily